MAKEGFVYVVTKWSGWKWGEEASLVGVYKTLKEAQKAAEPSDIYHYIIIEYDMEVHQISDRDSDLGFLEYHGWDCLAYYDE